LLRPIIPAAFAAFIKLIKHASFIADAIKIKTMKRMLRRAGCCKAEKRKIAIPQKQDGY